VVDILPIKCLKFELVVLVRNSLKVFFDYPHTFVVPVSTQCSFMWQYCKEHITIDSKVPAASIIMAVTPKQHKLVP